MGAPKQKWTSEEEAALKAGIAKHGVGKWSTILKDQEFSIVLRSRSNVDLKVWQIRLYQFYYDFEGKSVFVGVFIFQLSENLCIVK